MPVIETLLPRAIAIIAGVFPVPADRDLDYPRARNRLARSLAYYLLLSLSLSFNFAPMGTDGTDSNVSLARLSTDYNLSSLHTAQRPESLIECREKKACERNERLTR